MSSFIYENGTFISFSEYLLSESIKPKEIDFGTNYDSYNNKAIVQMNKLMLTSFKFNNKLYTVIIDKNNSVGFHWSEIPENEISYYDIIGIDSSGDLVQRGTSAIKTFSYVFYIIIQMIKKFKIDEIKFDAAHKALGNVYDNIVKNKYFLEELEHQNLVFIKKENNEYLFKRK